MKSDRSPDKIDRDLYILSKYSILKLGEKGSNLIYVNKQQSKIHGTRNFNAEFSKDFVS